MFVGHCANAFASGLHSHPFGPQTSPTSGTPQQVAFGHVRASIVPGGQTHAPPWQRGASSQSEPQACAHVGPGPVHAWMPASWGWECTLVSAPLEESRPVPVPPPPSITVVVDEASGPLAAPTVATEPPHAPRRKAIGERRTVDFMACRLSIKRAPCVFLRGYTQGGQGG
jgi:hypothetical protein